MFSSRLPAALDPNPLSLEIARLRLSGASLIDLTETNPTRVGLSYPATALSTLADPQGLTYQPLPYGLPEAREAVARDCGRQGRAIPADRIVLTASTSEAYALLFKLLCDPDDEVLVPRPSYPLFDLLTRLENVTAVPYMLEYHGAWSIDRASFERALTPRTKAVLVVSPNNPTGSMLRSADLEWLSLLCAERSLALIGDEVFADYPLAKREDACFVTGQSRALTFSLGGLSKSAGLPQVKLGWMAVTGPDALVTDALARLEVIADTYLSVNTPVQLAAAGLLDAAATIRAAIMARVQRNLGALREALKGATAVSLLEPEGGWCAVVQVPAIESEEALVLGLITEAQTIVHPGYFFDFPSEAFLVVSLLPEPAAFDEGIARMLRLVSSETR